MRDATIGLAIAGLITFPALLVVAAALSAWWLVPGCLLGLALAISTLHLES